MSLTDADGWLMRPGAASRRRFVKVRSDFETEIHRRTQGFRARQINQPCSRQFTAAGLRSTKLTIGVKSTLVLYPGRAFSRGPNA